MSVEDDLAIRRKRLLWRASHRGIKEMDILVGGFAARELPRMDERDLSLFERLLETPDQDLLAYATFQVQVPDSLDCPMLRNILSFRPQ